MKEISENTYAYMPDYMYDAKTGEIKAEYQDVAANVSSGVAEMMATLPTESAQSIFRVLLDEESLAPEGDASWGSEALDATLERIAALAARIDQLFVQGGSTEDIIILIYQQLALQQQSATDARAIARESAEKQLLAQASDLTTAARKAFDAAKYAMFVTVGTAGATALLSGGSLYKGFKGAAAGKEAALLQRDADKIHLQPRDAHDAVQIRDPEAVFQAKLKGMDAHELGLQSGGVTTLTQSAVAPMGGTTSQFVHGLETQESKLSESDALEDAARAGTEKDKTEQETQYRQAFNQSAATSIKVLNDYRDQEAAAAQAVAQAARV